HQQRAAAAGPSKGRQKARAPRPRHAERRGNGSALQDLLDESGAPRARMPLKHAVELATLVDAPPAGGDWLNEIKFDGYRMLCRLSRGRVNFVSRNGLDWTRKFPELAGAASELAVDETMLDGEVVALKPDGTSSFQALQNVFQAGRTSEL